MARRKLDKYYTPENVVKTMVAYLDGDLYGRTILEPCCGNGDIVRLLPSKVRVFTNDIDPGIKAIWHSDASDGLAEMWHYYPGGWDWVITNPPYNRKIMSAIIANALCAASNVAMLLRISALEPTGDREQIWKQYGRFLSELIIFGQPRPSFTGDRKTDSVTTAWFIWRRDRCYHENTIVVWKPHWKVNNEN